ncbi:C4-dicarboxylate ABC transporter [Bifidobacterium samirii]|uniref:C4-dicarboxylate ABC transporter n=1 Tax=Bifidobacterium samirii TaxID=2306974 RepID=UPI0013DFC51D|nr:C4-dicarboxylate ABC transporter [Bifidobacterium samirii]
MADYLPMILWLFAVAWTVAVGAICAARGRLLTGEHRPEVPTVSWNVVAAQALSTLFIALPFMVFVLIQEKVSAPMRAFYERYLWIGVGIVLVLAVLAWVMMFLQAKRAERTQADQVLKRRHGTFDANGGTI